MVQVMVALVPLVSRPHWTSGMEHALTAPFDGVVAELRVAATVAMDETLAVVTPPVTPFPIHPSDGLNPCCSAPRSRRPNGCGAFGLTEPDGGSDAGASRTTARLDEATNEWVINGSKCFITNSDTDITGLITVTAATGTMPDGRKETSAIIVPAGTRV